MNSLVLRNSSLKRLLNAQQNRSGRHDLARYGGFNAAALAAKPWGTDNELKAVITADEQKSWIKADEILGHDHHITGLAKPPHALLQAQTAVLIDHDDKFQPPGISGGVNRNSIAQT